MKEPVRKRIREEGRRCALGEGEREIDSLSHSGLAEEGGDCQLNSGVERKKERKNPPFRAEGLEE